MGCFKKILQIIILSLALIGFISIGGKDWLVDMYMKHMDSSKESVMERASKIGDFSKLSEEYSIDKAASAFGYQGVLAEHEASGQKMIIVDTNKKPIITKDDFKNGTVDDKMQKFLQKIKYQSIQVDDFTITKQGTMKAYNQDVPYVRFTAKINKLPVGQVGGIISAVETDNNNSKMLISVNENKKYSQLITDEFFKNVK
ncbi:hypothetical protein IKE67_10220 [bacterium]|nr:hypothetical protein [bacterium]